MPDQPPASSPATPPTTPPTTPPPAGPTINIGEEFGTAKRNLPPGKIVVIAIVLVGIVVAVASFLKRAKPQASGTLDNVVGIEIPGQNSTMVALTFTLHNTSDKTLYVRSIQSSMKDPSGEATADAVSAVDFDRYFQAFPALKNGIQPALAPEAEIPSGQSATRSIIVAFPKTLDDFNHRRSVSVIVWAYNETVPIVMTK
jgi:hypothetical protein